MSYITKFGSFWGMYPQTEGRIFWVAPAASYTIEGTAFTASDGNDGLSPERALLTVAQAITNATANVGDVILLLPGAHTVTATITVSKSGLTFTGLPHTSTAYSSRGSAGPKKHRTTITNTDNGEILFTVSAGVNDTEFSFLHILPAGAGGVGIYLVNAASAAGANRTYIHDCTFAMVDTVGTSTYGVQLGTLATGSTVDTLIRNCYFQSGDSTVSGANGAGVVTIGTAFGLEIANSTFANMGTAAWARAVESISAGTTGMLIRECDFINSTTATSLITTAVYATAALADGSIHMYRCYVAAGTDGVTAQAIVDVVLAESYIASSLVGGQILFGNV